MHEIGIELRPSKQFIALILLLIIASFSAIDYLPLPVGIKLLLSSFSLAYGAWILLKDGLLLHKSSIVRLLIEKEVCYLSNHEEVFAASLMGDSTVTGWVCVLRFRLANKRFKKSVVIFKDMVEPEMYRRLVVFLRSIKAS